MISSIVHPRRAASGRPRSSSPRRPGRLLLLPLLLAAFCAMQEPALAQADAGEQEGEGVPFEFVLPKGWAFDQENAAEADAVAIFYPEGTPWKESKKVIYLRVAEKKDGATMADMMAADSTSLAAQFPGIRINPAPSIRTVDGKIALVRHVSGAKNGKREATAYIDGNGSVIMLVLSARGGEAFEGGLEPFEFLAGAFHIAE